MAREKPPNVQLVQLQNYAIAREAIWVMEEHDKLVLKVEALEKELAAKAQEVEFFGGAYETIRSAFEQHLRENGNASGGESLAMIDRLVGALSPSVEIPDAPERQPAAAAFTTRVEAPASSPEKYAEYLDLWRGLAANRWRNPTMAEIPPHEGKPGPKRIAVFNSGGVGDALQLTPLIRGLAHMFGPCEIALLQTSGALKGLYERNPEVRWLHRIDRIEIEATISILKEIDVFDMTVYVRGYAAEYQKCHGSRIGGLDTDRWLAGNADITAVLRPIILRSPRYNNLIGRMIRPYHYYDLLGATAGLPIDSHSQLSFFPDPADVDVPERLALPGPYITVHDGFDQAFAARLGIRRSTKQLPEASWEAIVRAAKRVGLNVVQVGTAEETPIDGVDIDLCGKTSLSQLAFVLKQAVAHLDTEGGLVHLARAANTRSIVWFGPTSPTFFGYPGNINIVAEGCTDCWWIQEQWMGRCVRQTDRGDGAAAAECMRNHHPDDVVPLLENEWRAKRNRRYRLVVQRLDSAIGSVDGPPLFAALQARIAAAAKSAAETALIGEALLPLAEELAAEDCQTVLFVPPPESGKPEELLDGLRQAAGAACAVECASPFNLPADTDGYDLVICAESFAEARHWRAALGELLRLVRVGGKVIVALSTGGDRPPHLAEAAQAVAALCGVTLSIGADGLPPKPLAGGFVLERDA